MTQAKHTPGPWIKSKYDETGGYDCMTGAIEVGPACLDGRDYGQEWCQEISEDALERMEADARMIAAAPDLLASLKELLFACEDDCGAVADLSEFDGDDEAVGAGMNEDGSPDPMALTFGHLRRAARAIAKAEGRS